MMKFTRKKKRPVILIDIDGVCIKWQSGLPYYLSQKNINTDKAIQMNLTEEFMPPSEIVGMDNELASEFIRDYNKSKFIKYLSAYDDALEMINEMKEHWDFVAVTALGTDKQTVMNRVFNLNALFPGAFKDIFVCELGESKNEVIKKAFIKHDNIVMFVDDLAANLESAFEVIPEIPRYHLVRGERTKPKCDCFTFKSLTEIKTHYLANVFMTYQIGATA